MEYHQEDSFINEIPHLLLTLPLKLDIPIGEIDLTANSLNKLDEAIRRKGRRECLQERIYRSLVAYVGEVIRLTVGGQWELKRSSEYNQNFEGAWIVTLSGRAESPHQILYEQLYEGHTCYVAAKVEGAIRRLQENRKTQKKIQEPILYEVSTEVDNSIIFSSDKAYTAPNEIDLLNPIPLKAHSRAKEWLLQSIIFYKKLFFLKGYVKWSEKQLENKIDILKKAFEKSLKANERNNFLWEFYPEALGEDFNKPSWQFSDVYLLKWDSYRTWSETEVNQIQYGENEYVKALKRWSQISRGAFNPINIKEIWRSKNGPILIEFAIDSERFQLEPEYLEDIIDLSILSQINHLIQLTSYQFEICECESKLVITLLKEEKYQLEQTRGLQFNWSTTD